MKSVKSIYSMLRFWIVSTIILKNIKRVTKSVKPAVKKTYTEMYSKVCGLALSSGIFALIAVMMMTRS